MPQTPLHTQVMLLLDTALYAAAAWYLETLSRHRRHAQHDAAGRGARRVGAAPPGAEQEEATAEHAAGAMLELRGVSAGAASSSRPRGERAAGLTDVSLSVRDGQVPRSTSRSYRTHRGRMAQGSACRERIIMVPRL